MKCKHIINVIVFIPGDFDELYLNKILFPLSKINYIKIFIINRPADLIIDITRGYKRLKKRLRNKVIEKGKIKIYIPFVFFNEVIHESFCSYLNINMKMLSNVIKRLIKEQIRNQIRTTQGFH